MKNSNKKPHKFLTLSDAHKAFGLPQPKHPLISMVKAAPCWSGGPDLLPNHVLSFYKISYKPKLGGKIKYGQGYYDFDEGGLLFASPGQVVGAGETQGTVYSEYTLLIHPDFFLGHSLAKTIHQYGFFSYSTNEALHLSEQERATIISLFSIMDDELNSRIDDFSHKVILAQVDLLLNYADRFYKRQFLTRQVVSNDLLERFEELLSGYFDSEQSLNKGLPTVHELAEQLNLSASYLSDMLRTLTGENAQQHIHGKLIEKAKEKLSTTTLSVGEVAYALGFEHPQSFNKLFKMKTKLSPLAFRRSFN